MTHALATTMDFVPTVMALAGASLPSDRTFDGLDLAPVLFRNATVLHDNLFFSVGGEVYNTDLPGQSRRNPVAALYEAVRTARWSAMHVTPTPLFGWDIYMCVCVCAWVRFGVRLSDLLTRLLLARPRSCTGTRSVTARSVAGHQ